jgi:hypothetical protein
MYLPALFRDVLGVGGKFSDWYLTPAPYFFPDYPLFLLDYLAAPDAYWQVLAFMLLQCALVWGVVYALAHEAVSRHRIMVASLSVLLMMALSTTTREPFVLLLASAYHYGTFIAGIMLVCVWLRLERTTAPPARRGWSAAAFALAFLSSLSDNLFALQVIVPLCATAAVFHFADRTLLWRNYRLAGGVALASVLGSASYGLLVAHRTRYHTRLGLRNLDKNLHDLGQVFHDVCVNIPAYGIAFGIVVLFGLACTLRTVARRPVLRLPRPLLWLLVFSTLTISATLCALLLIQNLPIVPRYLIPVFLWPMLIAVLLLAHSVKQRFPACGLAASALLSLSLVQTSGAADRTRTPVTAYYPEQLACIDRALAAEGAHAGIADYWDAKSLQEFSQHPVQIAQYTPDLKRMDWITSAVLFRPAYDFAIIDDNGDPLQRFGKHSLDALKSVPKKSVSCGGKTVLLYGQGQLHVDNGSAVD